MTTTAKFDWTGELNKTVIHSLVTTFGLDFLLMEDKKGGDVDTIHNARKYQKDTQSKESSDIHISNELAGNLDKNGRNIDPYKKIQVDSQGNAKTDPSGKIIKKDEYHNLDKSNRYQNRKAKDKAAEDNGTMVDGYTGEKIRQDDIKKQEGGKYVTELDHVIAASEVHDDLGRILSGLDGVSLANDDSNLVSTHWVINNAKSDHSFEDFLKKGGVRDKKVESYQKEIEVNKEKLNDPSLSIEEKQELQKTIDIAQRKKELLEGLDEEKLKAIEKQARKKYNDKINFAYYTSSKFFKNTAIAAGKKGLQMGARQALGLILAEIWFELKEALPNILQKCQINFSLEMFWGELKNTLNNIFERVKLRFKDALNTFKDSFIAGVLSSITNTVLNIFLTSTKLMGKLIRESWNNLVQVIKLLVLNPQKLAFGDLMREITRLIFASVSTILGVMLNQHLVATVLTIPFGTEIAAFVSALFTGLLMVGTAYFIDYSPIMKKVWEFLNSLKNKYDVFLDHMKEINAELNAYVTNLAKIEFNLNPQELRDLSNALSHASNEVQKGQILQAEIDRRGIELPYEMGNSASTMAWLQSKAKKLHG